MKTRPMREAKAKVVKSRRKQTKAKLPQYKKTNKVALLKKDSVLKNLIMNSPGPGTKNVRGSSSSESTGRSEQLDYSKDRSLHSTKPRTPTGKNSKRYSEVSKQQQRNLGAPVIVESHSSALSHFVIPKILKQNHELRSNSYPGNKLSRVRRNNPKKEEACIIVAESVNPNNNADTGTATSSNNNRRPRRARTSLTSGKDNVADTWNENEPSASFEDCLRNLRIDKTEAAGSLPNAETEFSSSKKTSNSDQGPIRFYSLRNKIVAVMSGRTQFCFTGKIVLKVIFGTVEVYGYLINEASKPFEIYSPRGYSSICVKAVDTVSQHVQPDVWTTLSAEGVDRDTENRLVAELDGLQAGTTILLLSNLENNLTRFLNAYCPFRLFPSIKDAPYQSWTDPKRAQVILQSQLFVDNYACKELIVDERITKDVAEKMLKRWRANERCCISITGGKNVGKSTAVRCLINSLLPVSKKVVLVDVDPGQTECAPAGCMSFSLIDEPLLGPNFTHLKTPVCQLYLGDIDVSKCITRYIEGMKMLVEKLSSCPVMSRLPIVVNTMGFTSGIGWDLAIFTIKLAKPFLVVQIMSEKVKNNYPEHLSKEVINQVSKRVSWGVNVANWNEDCSHELCVIPSHAERKSAPVNDTWNMEPYQHRELVMTSYLSEILRDPVDSMSSCHDISLNINTAVPYVTRFSSLIVSIPRASMPPTHVLNVINGNIVALCGIDLDDPESQQVELVSNLRVLDRPPICSCYGFGIVRGVDTEREEIFLNTPLSAHAMQYVNCLVGCIPVPVTLLQLNQQRNVPYTGGSNELPTSREHRRGYFRMRYQRANANS
ncbi:polynucleotide 5'-hydroxyl-kinase NOL9 isoform X2 [Megalopta genalis]|uniref:polynucleotide 5'-hydroxyl-kinase NOL9 isoform X2 n=1 Tax=Megalopta genalis TaxID=115081 RepID=UPI003FD5EBA2